jgi:hypothetical protein
MVYFVLTSNGFRQVVATLGRCPAPVWLNAGLATDLEVASLRSAGMDLTVFSMARDPLDRQGIEEDVETIQMHHEGETIWVEWVPIP